MVHVWQVKTASIEFLLSSILRHHFPQMRRLNASAHRLHFLMAISTAHVPSAR